MSARRWLPLLAIAGVVLGIGSGRSDHVEWRQALDAAERAAALGDEETAEDLYREALGRAEALGTSDLRLARTLDALAYLYQTTGRVPEAEPLYERALGIWEATLGDTQPRVATTLHNLGAVKLELGRTDEAEPLIRRALELWEATLGPEHPDVGVALQSLATVLRRSGRHGEAEPLERRARAVRAGAGRERSGSR